MKYRMGENYLQQIVCTPAAIPFVIGIVLYGSRAMGNYKPGSDIDIVLLGKSVSYHDMLDVISQLDNLGMLYTFDVQRINAITNNGLLSHIHKNGVVLFNTQ